jgi:hypothetical protein
VTDRHAQLAAMATAAMNAILEVTRADDGASYIDPTLCRQALVACLASVLEADPKIQTRRDMREACELVARETRMQMQAVRDHFEETGERGWDAAVVPVQ